MSDSTQLTVQPKASDQLAAITGMERSAMLSAIKAQCFRGNPDNITDAQLAAFVSIAAAMGVNPLLPGMLYAFPISGGGIVPMIGPDGVFKKLAEHSDVDSWEVTVYPEDPTVAPTYAIAKIWRKGREKPLTKTCTLAEWKISSNPNWSTRPRHFLELRTLKQCARQIIHGIPFDEDERHIMEEINVTPQPEAPPAEKRPDPPKREKKGAAAVVENARKEQGEGKTIDVQAEPPKEAAREPAKEPAKTEPPKQETPPAEPPKPAEQPPAAASTPTPRALLKPDEEITANVTVKTSTGMMIKPPGGTDHRPSVLATVDGDFVGQVAALDCRGAEKKGDVVVVPPEWAVGSRLTLKLLGRAVGKHPNAPKVTLLEWAPASNGQPPTMEME